MTDKSTVLDDGVVDAGVPVDQASLEAPKSEWFWQVITYVVGTIALIGAIQVLVFPILNIKIPEAASQYCGPALGAFLMLLGRIKS